MAKQPRGLGHVYISYARADLKFVRQLAAELKAHGYDLWLDFEDIPAGSDWRSQIDDAIASASNVVVVLSPDAVASQELARDVETAASLGKRIIPLLHRDVDPSLIPESVAKLNWIVARDEDDFDNAVAQIVEAISTDYEWIDAHTRLLQRALEWERNDRDKSFLLRGRAAEQASAWLAEAAGRTPPATPLQAEYIIASDARPRLRRSRRGSQTKVSVEARPPAPRPVRRARFDISPRMISDTPSPEDTLGFAPLVSGLYALINDERTTLPLAIAVTAPWGAGKSSLMLQLRKRLEATPNRRRRWFTVRFDAWKYEKSERMWAALAKAIYDQTQARMTLWERVRFRMRLERLRQGGIRYATKIVVPAVAGTGIAAVGLLSAVSTAAGASIALGGLVAAATAAGHVWGLVGDPFKRAIDHYVSRPRYEEQIGFTPDAEREITSLATALGCDEGDKGNSALAIFVDDLDRCSSRHVVEVVEAINQIFNSAEGRRCVFVLGMDRDVVAASIDVAYRDTLEFLATRGSPLGTSFGLHFLAKIVQLSVAIPRPDEPAMRRLFAQITGNTTFIQGNGNAPAAVERPAVERFARLIAERRPENPADVEDVAASLSESVTDEAERRALDEAQRLQRGTLFTADSDDVAAAEFEVLQRLGRNPRQVKRFDNALRLQLHVANGSPGCTLSFGRDQLIALGKWVGLRLLRPELAADLDAEPDLAAELEAAANDSSNGAERATNLRDRYARWFADPEVARVLRDEHEHRRLASLPRDTFLHVI